MKTMKMKKMKNSILLIAAVAVLAACGPLGKYHPVTEVPVNLYGQNVDTSASTIADLSWKELFTDVKLQALIEEALSSNLDLKMSQEHIAQAEAALTGARLQYVPSLGIDLQGSGAFAKSAKPTYSYNLAAPASWEIDIFGRTANNIASAKATVAQMQDYEQAVRSSVVAAVANTYYTLLMLDAELKTAHEMEKVWKHSVETILEIKEEGFADEVAVNQYQATLASIRSTASNLVYQIAETENAMAILLGKPSMKVERGKLYEQVLPENLCTGVPVEMLTRRPDVRAAQRDIEIAFCATKSAWLNFFPTLTLSGAGFLTNVVNGSIVPMTALANLSAGLVAPILNRGVNRTRLRVAESQQREASFDFDKTLYEAGIEVNNAISLYKTCKEKSDFYGTQVRCLEQARQDTELIMNNSEDKTYLDVLMAHNSLIDATFSQISNHAQCLQAIVTLYSALGGGVK